MGPQDEGAHTSREVNFAGLDYADQRFYASTYGRFNTPDPYQASGGPSSPASWNRYAYTRGDPVNRIDPRGRVDCDPDDYACQCDDPASSYFASCGSGDCGDGFFDSSCSDSGQSGGGGGSTQPPPPAQPPPPPPSCTVEVGYLPNVFGTSYSHSFLELGVGGTTQYIEVSPSFLSVIPSMKVNFTATGIYNDSTAGIDFWSEQSPQACAAAGAIYNDSEALPPAYYLGLVSNSNSFVSFILGEAGVTAPPLVGGPPNAIGWGGPIAFAPILSTPVRVPLNPIPHRPI
jgi:RHS repeat-associated protein